MSKELPLASIKVVQLTVGTAAVAVTTGALSGRRLLKIKAAAANSGIVYLGASSAVLTTTGYPLGAGNEIELPVAGGGGSAETVWAIASAASQLISVLEGA